MEIESIAVICLVTLVVLIVQIIVTLRVFVHLHMSHKRDEEHDLQTRAISSQSETAQAGAGPSTRPEPKVLTVPGPAYPASSIYSVQTDNSDSPFSSEYHPHFRALRPWSGTSAAGRLRDLKDFHSDSESEFGTPSYGAAGRAKKQDIVNQVWARKP